MTSMRIDGGKPTKVWARRMQGLVDAAKADGVFLSALEEDRLSDFPDLVLLYKDDDTASVSLRNGENEE